VLDEEGENMPLGKKIGCREVKAHQFREQGRGEPLQERRGETTPLGKKLDLFP